MNVRSIIVGVLLAAAPIAAHAQFGIYINPIAQRISNSNPDTGLYAFLGQNRTSQMFYGVNIGAYFDFKTPYAFKAGLDMRDSILHGNGAEINNFDVGVRFSGKPFAHTHLKPYVEPFVGAGTTRAPFTVLHVTRAEYGALVGLDYETRHHIDFRIIEAGYSSLITVSSETTGGSMATIPASNIINISTGIVFRFP